MIQKFEKFNEDSGFNPYADQINKITSEIDVLKKEIEKKEKEIKKLDAPNKGLKLRTNSGQTTATKIGINSAKFNNIATLDGDGQNDPNDILKMIDILQSDPNIDLVQGYRLNRVDNKYTRKIPSKIANKLVRLLADQHIKDLGCSLRVFKNSFNLSLITS